VKFVRDDVTETVKLAKTINLARQTDCQTTREFCRGDGRVPIIAPDYVCGFGFITSALLASLAHRHSPCISPEALRAAPASF
jgi:hypothetical protein